MFILCWAHGDFGHSPSPPELSAHPWKDPRNFCPLQNNSSRPLNVPQGGHSGVCGHHCDPQDGTGLGQGPCSLTHIPGRGRQNEESPKMSPLPRGDVFGHPQVPSGSIHARLNLARLQDTNPQEIQRCHPPLPAAASTFWEWSCLERHRAPHLFLSNVIKALKRYNGSSGVQQSRDCWISQLLLLTEAVPLGYCTY